MLFFISCCVLFYFIFVLFISKAFSLSIHLFAFRKSQVSKRKNKSTHHNQQRKTKRQSMYQRRSWTRQRSKVTVKPKNALSDAILGDSTEFVLHATHQSVPKKSMTTPSKLRFQKSSKTIHSNHSMKNPNNMPTNTTKMRKRPPPQQWQKASQYLKKRQTKTKKVFPLIHTHMSLCLKECLRLSEHSRTNH